jgi:hypothetical protein
MHAHAREQLLSDCCKGSQGEREHDARVAKSREAWDKLSMDDYGNPMDMEESPIPAPRTSEEKLREKYDQHASRAL